MRDLNQYEFWLPGIAIGLVFKVIQQFALNILWFPSDYSTFTSCYYCSQSPHQTENFPTTALRKSVDLTTSLKGVYYLLLRLFK